MCLALRASGLWLRYATLQNLIPSFLAIWQLCIKEMKYPEGGDSGQYLLQKPLIVNIGAILGSIGGYQGSDYGGFYPYRTSKAGMHMLTKVH